MNILLKSGIYRIKYGFAILGRHPRQTCYCLQFKYREQSCGESKEFTNSLLLITDFSRIYLGTISRNLTLLYTNMLYRIPGTFQSLYSLTFNRIYQLTIVYLNIQTVFRSFHFRSIQQEWVKLFIHRWVYNYLVGQFIMSYI